jgi:hypothetical protein
MKIFWLFTVCNRALASCCALILLWATMGRSAVDPLSQWHFSHPKPVGNDLLAVTFANGLFVAGGSIGTIITSSNGTDWIRQQTPITATLQAIAYGNGRFVAVGDGSAIISSPDGTNWVQSTITGTQLSTFGGVVWGNGLWVAANEDGYTATSRDGINWSVSTNRSERFSDVTFGNGKFVAVGNDSFFVSTDGTNWVPTYSTFPIYGGRLTFGNGSYLRADDTGYVMTSPDGFTWSVHETGAAVRWVLGRMAFDGTRFWMVARDVYSSTDGTNWVLGLSGFPTAAGAGGNGTLVMVGYRGLIFSSKDGSNWVNQSSITYNGVTNVNYANGRFVGTLSPRNFIISSNGSNWNLLSTATTNQIRKLIWTGDSSSTPNVYLGAAAAGMVVAGANITNLVASDTGAGVTLNSIAFGESTGIAVGDSGKIARSTDLASWNLVPSSTTNRLMGIAYGGGNFVCVGDGGTVLQSSDGMTFFPRPSPTILDFVDVTYGMGRFIAIENRGFLDISTNGINWQRINVSTSPWTCIGYGAGRFVLGSSSGTMRGSMDGGLTWTRYDSGNSVPMRSVVFGDGTFVAGGDSGAIIQSDPIVLLQIARSSDVALTVSGPRDREYQIEWTDHLPATTWNLLSTNTPSAESFTIHDSPPTSPRFYRAGVAGNAQ